jgi:hypothetical protein
MIGFPKFASCRAYEDDAGGVLHTVGRSAESSQIRFAKKKGPCQVHGQSICLALCSSVMKVVETSEVLLPIGRLPYPLCAFNFGQRALQSGWGNSYASFVGNIP